MNEDKFRALYETACLLGEEQSQLAITYANQNKILRRVIFLALGQMRRGQIDGARRTLERFIKDDEDNS